MDRRRGVLGLLSMALIRVRSVGERALCWRYLCAYQTLSNKLPA